MADTPIDNPQDPGELLDAELVRRAQQGESAAFDVLVRRYQHRIVALVARYVGDWSEAQDVAQDAFVRAWRSLHGFRGEAQFYTWLHRIAVNTAKNHLVAMKRRPPGADIEAMDAEQSSATQMRETATPERELQRHQVEQAVLRALAALPEELGTALRLREMEGLSYEEIATHMGCPIGTVRSRIFRAREAIDRELRPLLDSDATARERGRA
ncbi:RNA polymerase sigma factor RpoE [Luteimonas sp. e5]